MLSLLALILFINVSAVSAATTVDQDSIIKSTDTVKNNIETKHMVPSTLTVADKKVTSSQYLQLLTETVSNVNKNNKNSVTVKTISNPPQSSESLISGSLNKNEYVSMADRVNTFISKNDRLPNYVNTSLGKMRYENVIYTYTKVLSFYKTNKRLPITVSVTPWNSSSGEGKIVFKANATTQEKIDAIGYTEAKFEDIQGQSSPTVMEKVGYGDCWADSYWLYNKLSAAGIPVRIIGTSSGGILYLHRWVEINIGNGWETWDYAKYDSQHYGALGTGLFVVKTAL